MQPPKSFKEWLALIPIIIVAGGMEAALRGCAKSASKSYSPSSSYTYTPPSKSYDYDASSNIDTSYKFRSNETDIYDIQFKENSDIPIILKENYFPEGDLLSKLESDFFELKESEWAHKHAIPHSISPHSDFYNNPNGIEYYSEVTKSPTLINIFPRNTVSYSKIFPDENITSNIKAELKKFDERIKNTEGVRSIDDASISITEQINESPERLVVIFAHSADLGMKIKLPDGSFIESNSLHKSCADAGKLCIILTCNGKDVEISGLISPFEALDIWDYAVKNSSLSQSTNREFLLAMRDKRHSAVYRKKLMITVPIVASGAVIVYFHNGEESNLTSSLKGTN